MSIDLIYSIFSILFGLSFGSFISLVTYRLPKNEDIIFKKSYCPKCNKELGFLSMIPILSWLIQKGKCKFCGEKIPIRYLIIESITGILFLFSYLVFGESLNTIIFDFIIIICLIIFFLDLESYFVSNILQFLFLFFSVIFIINNNDNFIYSIISAIYYFAFLFIAGFLVKLWKEKESIGWGDIWFSTIAGMLLKIENLSLYLFISGFIGLFIGILWLKVKKSEYFPFCPALIISFLFLFLLVNSKYFYLLS